MRIKKIYLENFRIFQKKQVLSLPKDNEPIVFVGINGAGKTSVLEAIIGSFYEFINKALGQNNISKTQLTKKDINIDADETSNVGIIISTKGYNSLGLGFSLSNSAPKAFKAVEFNLEHNDFSIIKSKERQIDDLVESLIGDVGFFKTEGSIPMLVYYPVERLVLNPSLESADEVLGNQFDAYLGALEKSVDFNDFFEWFRAKEDVENEMRLNTDNSYIDKNLDAVRQAVLNALDGFSKMRVKRLGIPGLVLEKGGKEFEINQLSHGEKALVAMVGDLARRLVTANPGHPNPLKGKGIALIDELELHLHPKWQKQVLVKLTKTFPKVQFICTTHSPLILNHAKKESVFIIDNGEIQPLTSVYPDFNIYGADVPAVLRVVQGTEELLPSKVQEKLQSLFLFIQNNQLDEANDLVNELKKMIGESHPEIQKAETQIEYKNLIRD